MEFKKLLQYVEDHKNQHLKNTIAENNRKIEKRVREKKGLFVKAATLESTSNNK